MKTIKNIKKHLAAAKFKAITNVREALNDNTGAAGEHGVLWLGAIIIALIVIAAVLGFFRTELAAWLQKLKEKLEGFWGSI